MTRKLILVWADSETGKVMNLDGTSSSVIVPKEPFSYVQPGLIDRVFDVVVTHKTKSKLATQPLYAASKVDLSSAAVPLPKLVDIPKEEFMRLSTIEKISRDAWMNCLEAITAQMPKGE